MKQKFILFPHDKNEVYDNTREKNRKTDFIYD